jgi:hypothetical protein
MDSTNILLRIPQSRKQRVNLIVTYLMALPNEEKNKELANIVNSFAFNNDKLRTIVVKTLTIPRISDREIIEFLIEQLESNMHKYYIGKYYNIN